MKTTNHSKKKSGSGKSAKSKPSKEKKLSRNQQILEELYQDAVGCADRRVVKKIDDVQASYDLEFQILVDCLLILGRATTNNEKMAKEFAKSKFKVVEDHPKNWQISI